MIAKKLIYSALSLCVFANTAIASSEFSTNFNSFIKQHDLPGAVVLVKQGNDVVHYDAYGKVNIDKPQLIEKESIFRIFSMSKPITAVALLQLVDQKKLALDDDIRKYLPEFDEFEVDGKPYVVTVHQLLSHTAGFGYGGGLKSWVDIRYLLANPLSRGNTLEELVDDLSGIDLKFAPGSRFEYSIASDVQGALVEAVSGLKLDEYFDKHIFTPLNMKDTGFFVPEEDKHRLVDMYEYDATTFEEALTFNKENIIFSEKGSSSEYLEQPDLLSGGGGLVSTASDYSNFVSMLHNNGQFNGKTILSTEMVKAMVSTKTTGLDTHFLPRIYKGAGFGYGVGVKEVTGDARQQGSFFWAGMGGTLFWSDPNSDLQVVVMMQVEDGWIALEKWLIPEVYKMLQATNS